MLKIVPGLKPAGIAKDRVRLPAGRSLFIYEKVRLFKTPDAPRSPAPFEPTGSKGETRRRRYGRDGDDQKGGDVSGGSSIVTRNPGFRSNPI